MVLGWAGEFGSFRRILCGSWRWEGIQAKRKLQVSFLGLSAAFAWPPVCKCEQNDARSQSVVLDWSRFHETHQKSLRASIESCAKDRELSKANK